MNPRMSVLQTDALGHLAIPPKLACGAEYTELLRVRQAKIEWLTKVGFPIDHFHAQAYGTTKANAVRKDLGENETAILFDDNDKVRAGEQHD